MTRTLTAGMQTAVAASSGDACHLILLEFSGGTLRLATASNNISWSGQTWVGIGGNLSIEPIQETREMRNTTVRVRMDGVDQTVISPLLAQNYIGRPCEIYLLHFDTDGTIVADPIAKFKGLLNQPFEVRQTDTTCEVTTQFVSPLSRFSEKRGIRASVISHQQHFNGDTFWRHLKGIADKLVYWGPDPTVTDSGIGSDGGNDNTGEDGDPQD